MGHIAAAVHVGLQGISWLHGSCVHDQVGPQALSWQAVGAGGWVPVTCGLCSSPQSWVRTSVQLSGSLGRRVSFL